LDPESAIEDWAGELGEIDRREEALEVLRNDARVLEQFQDEFETLKNGLGFRPTAELLGELVDRVGLRAFWREQDEGLQRIANVETFLDLVRSMESDRGVEPHRVYRTLEERADNDDPAAGGLAASRDADVVVTTYWQAKGREWPVVVLPEVHGTSASTNASVGPNRITMRDGPNQPPSAVHSADIRVTEDDPFSTEKTCVTELLDLYRKRAARAENRRLLYVAMTRAEDKVVLAGQFPKCRSMSKDRVTLQRANNWALAVYLAGGLVFEDGKPTLDPEGAWGDASDFDVDVLHPSDVKGPDEDAVGEPKNTDEPLSLSAGQLSDMADKWRPVQSRTRTIEDISSASALKESVPEFDSTQGGKDDTDLPEDPFSHSGIRGDVFHAGMERWAFAGGRPGEDLWHEVMDEFGAGLDGDRAAHLDYLDTLTDRVMEREDLVDELRQARARGELYPELPVRFPRDSDDEDDKCVLYRGYVDLVWRNSDGNLQLLDFKTGSSPGVTDDGAPEDTEWAEYYTQVELYREGLSRQLGEDVTSCGLWFAGDGFVVEWK
jgi:ATP-dependent exoDNAse (exonuclease V) beta subunit